MSNRRPTHRITAKNKTTNQFIELGVVWPPYQAGYSAGFSFNKELTEEALLDVFREAAKGKAGNYYLDMRENTPPSERQDF